MAINHNTIFKKNVKNIMGPIFESSGYRFERIDSNYIWKKLIHNGEYIVGIAYWQRNRQIPEFSMTIYLDKEDILDPRAYIHSGAPPRKIRKKLNLDYTIIDRVISGGYDVWFNTPKVIHDYTGFMDYANWLLDDLDKRTEYAINTNNKTRSNNYEFRKNSN